MIENIFDTLNIQDSEVNEFLDNLPLLRRPKDDTETSDLMDLFFYERNGITEDSVRLRVKLWRAGLTGCIVP